MSSPGERWRIARRAVVTIPDVIDQYQRLNSLHEAFQNNYLDPRDEQYKAREHYMYTVRKLLVEMVNHRPTPDSARRQELEEIDRTPDTGLWDGQGAESLEQYWTEARKELDHSIASVAGVPLLLSMTHARDGIIEHLDNQIKELRNNLDEQQRTIAQRDQQLAQLRASGLRATDDHAVREAALRRVQDKAAEHTRVADVADREGYDQERVEHLDALAEEVREAAREASEAGVPDDDVRLAYQIGRAGINSGDNLARIQHLTEQVDRVTNRITALTGEAASHDLRESGVAESTVPVIPLHRAEALETQRPAPEQNAQENGAAAIFQAWQADTAPEVSAQFRAPLQRTDRDTSPQPGHERSLLDDRSALNVGAEYGTALPANPQSPSIGAADLIDAALPSAGWTVAGGVVSMRPEPEPERDGGWSIDDGVVSSTAMEPGAGPGAGVGE